MKPFLLLLLSLMAVGATAQTEPVGTNAPAASTNALPASAPIHSVTNQIEILSDQGTILTETNYTIIYSGNVRASYGDAKLTCDELLIVSERGSERPHLIIADRNVVIDHKDKNGKTIHATGTRAVYTYRIENAATNEIVVLTGDAKIQYESHMVTGDPITWDLVTGQARASGGQRTVIGLKDDAISKIPFGQNRTNAPAIAP